MDSNNKVNDSTRRQVREQAAKAAASRREGGANPFVVGASTAAGAVLGTIAGAFASQELHAMERDDLAGVYHGDDVEDTDGQVEVVDVEVENHDTMPDYVNDAHGGSDYVPQAHQYHGAGQHVDPVPQPDDTQDIEVISYERMTTDDGQMMDLAIVEHDGLQMAVVDVDLDGYADVVFADYNNDGEVTDDEYHLQDGTLSMQPMQDAVGFDPGYCADETPDYVNDADVDNYLA